MSKIKLESTATAEDLLKVLRDMGATVIWAGLQPSATTRVRLTVEVDAEQAYEALPSRYFEDEGEWIEPDTGVLSELIGACIAGDRSLASAMLHRLNLSERAEEAGDRMLLAGRGVRAAEQLEAAE